ncbi:MAG: UDP-N-acetylglucosamine--N-acetylmuramyl-(pentapeptide) pyrophosphoryl-undecaprenol [Frankiaceae bacterium]|jgi:UDP-N-acetylglucosamine--N-acetylmuramyl-(pentapeptide) pyrophosphoryl-undecaprenol N-acetylglucosamine transferase|nr:UDP-N-acetylglucosamine--N-acetylmuramyl-(pentapeptide) pyrophosphoryl-undecaprenol [Frankiaceae bacterium]
MRVLLAGGGTAGHVSPLLALADRLVADDPSTRVLALGTATGLEARLVPARGYPLHEVPRVPLPRRLGLDVLRMPVRLGAAVKSAGQAIKQVDAEVVVGFGGYVAAPAYLAARKARVPIVVHEQNSRPGFANRLGARLTTWVAVSFPGTPLRHAVRTGLPLRPEILTLDRAATRDTARSKFGLRPELRTVLVVGGSLGAKRLNDVVPLLAADLAARDVQVLHVSGVGKEVAVPTSSPGDCPYAVVPYVEAMELAYAAADLIICRAGANTVSEITALGLPAVYVPLPIGNGEQRLNAEPVAAAGGGLLVDDARFDVEWMRQNVLPLLENPDRLAAMGHAAAGFGVLDADQRLADLVRAAAASR